MSAQTKTSIPLYAETEEEKRKRQLAKNYLDNFSKYEKSGLSGMDSYSAARDANRTEDPGAVSQVKNNYDKSREEALDAGIGGPAMAKELLGKGQARIIGDSLIGSAAGISADEWESRDKAAASGGKTSVPRTPNTEMVEVAPGVRMSKDTAARFNRTNEQIAAQESKKKTDWEASKTKVAESIEKTREDRKNRDEELSRKSKAFFADIKNRQSRDGDIRGMREEAEDRDRLARRNYRNMRRQISRGKVIDSDTLEAAIDERTAAREGLGSTKDWDDRGRNALFADLYEKRKKEREARGQYTSNTSNPYRGG